MSTVEIRGNWLTHRAIEARWSAAGLDAEFRKFWKGQITEYPVLHDTEAKENPPGPYCIYEVAEPVTDHNSTGPSSHSEHKVQNTDVQFRVHAKDSGGRAAKTIAIKLAGKVAAAFDDQLLDMTPDTHVTNDKGQDFGVKEGDKEYAWVLPYTWTINAVIRRTVRGPLVET